MPNIDQMKDSKFLKKEDVGSGALLTMRRIVEENVAMEGQAADLKWCLYFDEFPKPMILNSTNLQLIAQITASKETDDWTGKKIVLYNDPSISFGGKLVGGVRVRAPKGQAKPPAAALPTEPEDFHDAEEPPY